MDEKPPAVPGFLDCAHACECSLATEIPEFSASRNARLPL